MRKTYNKLIRDFIPEIMDRAGVAYAVDTLDDCGYRAALKQKLVEEAGEVADAARSELVKELADMQEVMLSMMEAFGITADEVASMQSARREDRGGFDRRLYLRWTED